MCVYGSLSATSQNWGLQIIGTMFLGYQQLERLQWCMLACEH